MAQTQPPDSPPVPPGATADQPKGPGALARIGIFLGLVLVALAYLLPGLTGHDPWAPDEADTFGVVHGMATGGDPVVPTLAGGPTLVVPPGYAIGALGMVRLLADWLPMHDAARLTSGLLLALTLAFTGMAARRAWGPGLGGAAVLALIGSLGLLRYGHLMVADLALAAGVAMACLGLLRARDCAAWGGLWLGTGIGLAFMGKGPVWAAMLGLVALLLPVFGDWRNRSYPRALVVALVVAAPWLLVWPAELYLRGPDLFRTWLLQGDLGTYLEAVRQGPLLTGPVGLPEDLAVRLRSLAWFTFPVLPLAIWTLARRPRRAFANPGVRVALLVSLVGWGALLAAGRLQGLDALPLLASLALIAAGGVRDLPGWLVALCYWLCLLAFAFLALALWGLWGYGLVVGHPPLVPIIGELLPLDFRPTLNVDAALLAAALTLAWILAIKRLRPTRPASLAAWPLGLTLTWGLAMLLHLPWLDAARSDRGVFSALAAQLPEGSGCLTTPAQGPSEPEATDWGRLGLSLSGRVLLHYLAGVEALPAAAPADVRCDHVLVVADEGRVAAGLDPGRAWVEAWQGQRPADLGEAVILFRRMYAPVSGDGAGAAEAGPGPSEVPPPTTGSGEGPTQGPGSGEGDEPAPAQEPGPEPGPTQEPVLRPAPQPAPGREQVFPHA
jgi:4-amino-4-deoxy-L-arabinose transferase-like glycosyltransferase